MNIEGKCIFSGSNVPRGKGTTIITRDEKSCLYFSKKYKSFHKYKIKPKCVKHTLNSKQFYGKVTSVHTEKKTKVQTKKIVRGFPSLPKAAVEKTREKVQKERMQDKAQGAQSAQRKVSKSENKPMKPRR